MYVFMLLCHWRVRVGSWKISRDPCFGEYFHLFCHFSVSSVRRAVVIERQNIEYLDFLQMLKLFF